MGHPPEADLSAVPTALELHELAVEDSLEFGQRPELDVYGDQLLLVVYGMASVDGLPCALEVHVHVAAGCVVTISRVPPARLERVRGSIEQRGDCSQGLLLHRILDALDRRRRARRLTGRPVYVDGVGYRRRDGGSPRRAVTPMPVHEREDAR